MSAQAEPENRHPLVLSPHTAWRGLAFPVNASWKPLTLICIEKAPHLDSLQADQHASVTVYKNNCCPYLPEAGRVCWERKSLSPDLTSWPLQYDSNRNTAVGKFANTNVDNVPARASSNPDSLRASSCSC